MASPFWTYFHDKLNWLPIFRPGPVSALMKGLALHMDEVRADILWLREQWNPATCEMWLVERYGVSRGIFRNRFDTDESYRKRVVHAYAWHKLGGKVRGLESILRESGFDATISNLDDVKYWAHFRIDLPLSGKVFGIDEASLFWFLANEYKPARSVIDVLATRDQYPLPVHIAAGAVNLTRNMAFTWRWPLVFEGFSTFYGSFPAGRSSAAITFRNNPPPKINFSPRTALCACGMSHTRITPGFSGRLSQARGISSLASYTITRSRLCPSR